jgi:tetratricopeptide (TPR) repeat protein
MRKRIGVYCLLIGILVACAVRAQDKELKKDPLLVVALMIKNEAPVIVDTLMPMVNAGIDSFLIFDTGSTDDTVAKVRQFFSDTNIDNYAIIQESFIDFAASRNRALDLVDEYFPQAIFVLMPDAEWLLCNGKQLVDFCATHKDDVYASYLVRMVRNGNLEYYVDRLMHRASHCRFRSPVHEYLVSPSVNTIPSNIHFEWNSTQYGDDKSRNRWKRDVGYLLKAYAQDPTDARTAFYLGQTYACLGDKDNAFRFYQLRSQLPSWAEEDYETLYRLGETVEDLSSKDTNRTTIYDWPLALWYYLQAYSMRPCRIEPLIRIAQHYMRQEDYATALLFAWRAYETPYPSREILFVSKDMYNYTRYDIVAQCAFMVGEYTKGLQAINKALEYCPDDQHFKELLKIYQENLVDR